MVIAELMAASIVGWVAGWYMGSEFANRRVNKTSEAMRKRMAMMQQSEERAIQAFLAANKKLSNARMRLSDIVDIANAEPPSSHDTTKPSAN